MDFGDAVASLREGNRVTRRAWQASGGDVPFLILVPGSTITVSAGRPLGDAAPELVGTQVEYRPHIDKMGRDGTLAPWNPTHDALLADDWATID